MPAEVSILLPAFNAAETIDLCLRSVLRQTFANWECVVVDDGSADGTREIVEALAAQDFRIRLVSCEHRGLVASLNAGFEHCAAPLVARMDADDWMHRDRLELQVRALTDNPDRSAVGSHVRIFPRQPSSDNSERALPGEAARTRKGRGGYEAWINEIETPEQVAREAYVECPIAHPSLMIRRDVLVRHPYRDMGWPEDYDLVLRLLAAGESLAVVPRRLLGWRDHDARLSRTSGVYDQKRFVACKAHHLAATLLRGRKDYVLWGYGGTGRALAKAFEPLGLRPSHIVEMHPRRIGNQIRGADVIHPDDLHLLEGRPVVASVAGAGPRSEIRETLSALGYSEGVDFICAA